MVVSFSIFPFTMDTTTSSYLSSDFESYVTQNPLLQFYPLPFSQLLMSAVGLSWRDVEVVDGRECPGME